MKKSKLQKKEKKVKSGIKKKKSKNLAKRQGKCIDFSNDLPKRSW